MKCNYIHRKLRWDIGGWGIIVRIENERTESSDLCADNMIAQGEQNQDIRKNGNRNDKFLRLVPLPYTVVSRGFCGQSADLLESESVEAELDFPEWDSVEWELNLPEW